MFPGGKNDEFGMQAGFTLVEVLMVVLLVSVLAAVAIPQFIDFRSDAKDGATQSALGSLRSAIMNQYTQMKLRCGTTGPTYPTTAQINANDITTNGNPCTTSMITKVDDRKFFVSGSVPDNPWSGSTPQNTVVSCSGATTGCVQNSGFACNGAAYTATSSGWCYNSSTGQIWANSQNSTSAKKENTF